MMRPLATARQAHVACGNQVIICAPPLRSAITVHRRSMKQARSAASHSATSPDVEEAVMLDTPSHQLSDVTMTDGMRSMTPPPAQNGGRAGTAPSALSATDAATLVSATAVETPVVRQRLKTPKQVRKAPQLVRPPLMDEAALLNGVLLVDKPLEWTSFDVCGKLKGPLRNINVTKIGHAGTLDPMATGLLIVCTGKGTKWCDDYQSFSKTYTGTLRLGEGTLSHDLESEVSERLPWQHITDEQLHAAAAGFLGATEQMPPMFSAVKVKGEKLYNIARQGREIERQARTIHTEEFTVTRDTPESQDMTFRAVVSKGTYVRSLVADFGRALGTAAHLLTLRREAVGDFRVEDAWKLQDLITQLKGSDILNIVGRFRGKGQVAGAGAEDATLPRPKASWKTSAAALAAAQIEATAG